MKKLSLKAVATAISFSCLFSFTVYAGTWQEDGGKWKYVNDNGTYAADCWITDQGVSYYIDSNGFMLANTMTPDGLPVGRDGKIVADTETMPDFFSGSTAEFENLYYPFMEFYYNVFSPFQKRYDEVLKLVSDLDTTEQYARAREAVSQLNSYDFTPYFTSENIAIRKTAVISEVFRIEQVYSLSEITKAKEQQDFETLIWLLDKGIDSIDKHEKKIGEVLDRLLVWNAMS